MKTMGISVELKQAEKVRKYIIREDIINQGLRIKKNRKFIYFPVKRITKELKNYKRVETEFEEIKKELKNYKTELTISNKLKNKLPTSFDIVGDIILIKLQEELLNNKKEIGESLLKTNKNIKTVCLVKPVKGELRVRELEIIAGEKRTNTLHKEYGLKFHVDISNSYFSPRLATERKRIANQVKKDEIVVDMFTGVAPFSIMIAKYAQPKIIYALDKNKDAVGFAQKNVNENNFLDKIEIIKDDAKNIVKILDKKEGKADRIIMNLPFSSFSFFKYALKIISNSCIIHYYEILKEEKIDKRIAELVKIADKEEITLKSCNVNKIKTYAPREFYIGIDITATRNMPM